ncbi:hypothetical protein L226DRAFT_530965 [Lentinus tigrinus ALCF2SS1-7]|uniref:DUF6534 domain-containing protein n=1 Tax=Lentinus tigrinus ALCF2SS1-6 TaxID=1328759 RepID=A0A5C2SP93_9APHY|nr:hypothetical protein L227DRAFT_570779 [Lentinus tigrinus ALCF2SS1-6]RPD79140.1 hypothetical protein L226DRAFT_530965 [Lentinus tigrinus ALCF2SS1-7]
MAVDAEVRDKIVEAIPAGIPYNILNVCLFSLTCYQVLRYYLRNREDRTSLKMVWAVLWISEATYFLTMPMNMNRLERALDEESNGGMIWSLVIMVAAGTLSEMILRGFVYRRVWKLGNRSWLSLFSLIVLSIGYIYFNPHLPNLVLSGILCFLLARQRENSLRLRRIDNTPKAFAYVVSVGALPPLCVLISFVLLKSGPHTRLSMFYQPIAWRAYFNAMLATLNASWDDERLHKSGPSIPRSS